jgi:hypothetical protein
MGRNNLPPNNKIEKSCQLLSIIIVVDWPKAKVLGFHQLKKNPSFDILVCMALVFLF